jgi:hypothetical protein
MNQTIQNVLTAVASDKLMVASAASYLEKRISTATTILNDLEALLSEEIDLPDVEVDLDVNIPVNVDGQMLLAQVGDLYEAAVSDLDEFISDNNIFNYDEVVQQLSDSVAAGYAAVEAVRSLGDVSNNSNISDIITNFRSRIELRFAGLSDTAAAYGYLFLDALSDPHMPIKDKIATLLNMIGIGQAREYNGIGVPTCSFTDITGANVFTAFGAEIRDLNVTGVIRKVGEKIWSGLGKIVDSVFPQILNTAKKTWKAITGTWDAFKSSNEGSFPGFTDYGTTFKLPLHLGYTTHRKDTLQGILQALYYIIYDQDPINKDIFNVADSVAKTVNASYTSDGTIEKAVRAAVSAYDTYYQDLGMLPNLQNIYDKLLVDKKPLVNIVDHLSETQYTVFETPGSHIYVWIANGYVYFKFYWIPILNAHGLNYLEIWDPLLKADDIAEFLPAIAAWKTNGYGEFDSDAKVNLGIRNAKIITVKYLCMLYAGVHDPVSFFTAELILKNLFRQAGSDSADDVNNLQLAQNLTSNLDGSTIDLSGDPIRNWLGSIIVTALGYSMGDQYYAAYYRTNSTPIGQYNVIYDKELASLMSNIVIATVAIIAATASIIAVKKLSRRAYMMKARADAMTRKVASDPDATTSDFKRAYRMNRKAQKLQALVSKFSGSTKSMVSISASATESLLTNPMTNGVSKIMGLKESDFETNEYTLKSIRELIGG